ncbi:MAG: nucleoside 2-deoxyribosyltransferase [Candidatus Micrarchaeia archaeon]
MGKVFIGKGSEIAVYLASPLGFTEEGRSYIRDVLKLKISKIDGIFVIDPWSSILRMNESQIMQMGPLNAKDAIRIGRTNFELIRFSDIVLANLNGSDPDSGTCVEIGYAHALGKTVIGYRTDFRMSGDSLSGVNLQVETAIRDSGGKIFNNLDEALAFLKELVAEKNGVAHKRQSVKLRSKD